MSAQKIELPEGCAWAVIPPEGYQLHIYAGRFWALCPNKAPLMLSHNGKRWLNIKYPSPEASVIMPYIQTAFVNPHRKDIEKAQEKMPGGALNV